MKVKQENNKRMLLLSLANIFLMFVITLTNVNHIRLDTISYFVLHIGAGVVYILLLVYVINILQYANEKIAIQTPFNIYLGLTFIKFILSFSYTAAMSTLSMGIGMMNICIIIYLLITSFQVKNEKLSLAYRLFGLSLLLSMVVKIVTPFVLVISSQMQLSRYLGFMDVVEGIAIFYILRSSGHLLNTNNLETVNPDI